MLGMAAQMERRFIRERQREGIKQAKSAGVYHGGKRRIDLHRIVALDEAGQEPAAIAVGFSQMQIYRVLQINVSDSSARFILTIATPNLVLVKKAAPVVS